MAELEKVLKDVVLGSVGAVATVVEKGGEIARALVEKGQETVQNNQETVDNIRRKVREVCESVSGDKPEEVVVEGFEFVRTPLGLQLNCPLENITPEKAEAIRALLDQAEAESDGGDAPLLMRLDGLCPGVYVTIDVAGLPAQKRDEIRRLLDDVEAQANG